MSVVRIKLADQFVLILNLLISQINFTFLMIFFIPRGGPEEIYLMEVQSSQHLILINFEMALSTENNILNDTVDLTVY